MGIVVSSIKNIPMPSITSLLASLCKVLCTRMMPSFLITNSTGIDKMPPEILMKIFRKLDNKDLGNVVSVCTLWGDVGDCLWTWDILEIARDEIEMLGIKRVAHVEELLIEYDDDWSDGELNNLFESLTILPKLSYLALDGIPLTTLSPSLFVETVVNITSVDLSFCELTAEQLNMLFDEIDENLKLEYLEMKGVDMSQVDMNSLATGVNKLEFANLHQTQLSKEQVTALLRVAGVQTKLLNLYLDSNTIEGDPILHRVDGDAVDQEIVSQAKKNIKNMKLKYDFDNNSQWSTYKSGKIVCYVTGQ